MAASAKKTSPKKKTQGKPAAGGVFRLLPSKVAISRKRCNDTSLLSKANARALYVNRRSGLHRTEMRSGRENDKPSSVAWRGSGAEKRENLLFPGIIESMHSRCLAGYSTIDRNEDTPRLIVGLELDLSCLQWLPHLEGFLELTKDITVEGLFCSCGEEVEMVEAKLPILSRGPKHVVAWKNSDTHIIFLMIQLVRVPSTRPPPELEHMRWKYLWIEP